MRAFMAKKRWIFMCFHIHKICSCMHYLWIYWCKSSMNRLLPGLHLQPKPVLITKLCQTNTTFQIILSFIGWIQIYIFITLLSVSCQYDFSAWKHYKEIDEHTNKRVNESAWCIHHVSFKDLTFLTLFLLSRNNLIAFL